MRVAVHCLYMYQLLGASLQSAGFSLYFYMTLLLDCEYRRAYSYRGLEYRSVFRILWVPLSRMMFQQVTNTTSFPIIMRLGNTTGSAPYAVHKLRTASEKISSISGGLQGYRKTYSKPTSASPRHDKQKQLGGIPSLAIFFFLAKMEWRGNGVYLHI